MELHSGSSFGLATESARPSTESSLSHNLKFRQKVCFKDSSGGLGPGSGERIRESGSSQVGQPVRCQVGGCSADLSDAKTYYSRHKVCAMHSKSPRVIVAGLHQRFCQQCSRFHELPEFDKEKRSCRSRLAGHNERRRRKTQPPSLLKISPSPLGNATTAMNGSSLAPPLQMTPESMNPRPENYEGVADADPSSALSPLSNQPYEGRPPQPPWQASSDFNSMIANAVTVTQPRPRPRPGPSQHQYTNPTWEFKDDMSHILGLRVIGFESSHNLQTMKMYMEPENTRTYHSSSQNIN